MFPCTFYFYFCIHYSISPSKILFPSSILASSSSWILHDVWDACPLQSLICAAVAICPLPSTPFAYPPDSPSGVSLPELPR